MSSPVFIILSASKPRVRGCNKAAPFISIDGTKLINKQIAVIKSEYPSAKIILVIGYRYDEVRAYMKKRHPKVKLVKNADHVGTSSVESLRLASKFAGERNTFIIHGDRLFTRSAIRLRDSSYVSYTSNSKNNLSMGLSFDENNSLLHMSYGLQNVWSEITFIVKEDVPKLKSVLESNLYSIAELINKSNINFEVILDKNVKHLKEIL